MALVSVKTVLVYSGVAHESTETVDVNPNAIVMIKKVYFSIEQEVSGETTTQTVTFYKVSFSNNEALILTETEKNKLL